jgi:hypothetical protein
MNNPNDKLHQLLRQWQEIEPSANFDAQIWRRIRQAEPEPAPSFAGWLRDWLPRPALALSLAVVIGIAIGISSGMFSAPVVQPTEQLSFLAPNTLASALGR